MRNPSSINASAYGINHFTWFYDILDSESGEDLYPKLKFHLKRFPYLHEPLARNCFKEYGFYPVESDIHIGELLPVEMQKSRPLAPVHRFYQNRKNTRNMLTEWYGKGYYPLPLSVIPETLDDAVPMITALEAGSEKKFGSVNIVNNNCIPNLPREMIVEVPVRVSKGKLTAAKTPPMSDKLARIMKEHFKTYSMIVDSALNGNVELAREVIDRNPLSPRAKINCQKMFTEMMERQVEYLPF